MPVKREDLTNETPVQVAPFEATVVEVNATAATVKVMDDAGNVSFIYNNRLSLIAPYKPGTVYVSNGRSYYRYLAGTKPGENGTWQRVALTSSTGFTNGGYDPESYNYNYPDRPLREVTIGEPVTE